MLPYFLGDFTMKVMDHNLQAKEAAIKIFKFHMKRAQYRMKHYADK